MVSNNMIKVREVNRLIAEELNSSERGMVSDKYHTFDELYQHRYLLFIALCKISASNGMKVWKSRKNHDGSEWEGEFVLCMEDKENKQISYHIPEEYWDMIKCEEIEINDRFDGHDSDDVIDRLSDFNY